MKNLNSIAVMQPYFFPYIGYFQMINAVEKFVLYDDVNYIKNGWINRNQILNSESTQFINLIIDKATPNKRINELFLNQQLPWKKKLLKQIEQVYKKSPYFEPVFDLIKNILSSDHESLSGFLSNSLITISNYLDIKTKIITTSSVYNNRELDRQERLIDICKKENVSTYINAIGGMELYEKEDFKKEGIDLNFIKSNAITYPQFSNQFIPNLSIIDVMMFNEKEEIQDFLEKYTFI